MATNQTTIRGRETGLGEQADSPTHPSGDLEGAKTPATSVADGSDYDLRFYWGVASGSSRKAIEMAHKTETVEDHDQLVDLSAFPAPKYAMLSYETKNNIPKQGPEWFIDCGAYSALQKSDRHVHEKPVSEYIEYLIEHIDRGVSIERWALRDWPYSQEIMEATGRTIRDHQRWSVRDHIECLEAADELGLSGRPAAEPVPVIQGRDANDYLWHLDHMEDHGLLSRSSVVCIGSLVERSVSEVQPIIEQVRDALPSKYDLHGLGLKKSHLNNVEAVKTLDSVDSTVWSFSTMKRSGGANQTANWIDNLDAFVSYRNQLERVFGEQGDATTALTTGLSQFLADPSAAIGEAGFPLMECVSCGSLIDANAFVDTDGDDPDKGLTGPSCRHCERKKLNVEMGVRGLLCDPDVDGGCHPLCQH